MITTYPRKGTVPASPLPWIAAADYNLSPQGDGPHASACASNIIAMITTYPRKGTVPASPLPWIAAADYNLSPQGDGNFFFIRFSIIVPPFQLIPARGRKPLRSGGNVGFCNISTYPRKGTETPLLLQIRLFRKHFNLSPQGDGNPLEVAAMLASATFQLIPARGRKHLSFFRSGFLGSISTYPRKGTETPGFCA